MAEQVKGGGWVKMVVTSAFGLFSGAGIMYLSPLVDKVIKPSKPVANFAYQVQGLKVTFQNRSSGGLEGWWDFGDGQALEPFAQGQEAISHEYTRPGTYAVKLSLRNLLGEENERSVSVQLDQGSTSGAAPAIETLEVVPLRPDSFAPATFKVAAKVKNADLCIWALGDERPLEVSPDTSGKLERMATFRKPGLHRIKLVAISGKQTAERSEVVKVSPPPPAAVVAIVQANFEAVPVEKFEKVHNVLVAFPPKFQGNAFKFALDRVAEPGCRIVEAHFGKATADKNVKDTALQVSADKLKITLTGELLKPTSLLPRTQPNPSTVIEVLTVQERQDRPVTRPSEPIAMVLTVPGSTMLPLPKLPEGWVLTKRTLTLELRDGTQTLWQDQKLPLNSPVLIQNRTFQVTGTEVGPQLKLDVVEAKKSFRPAGSK